MPEERPRRYSFIIWLGLAAISVGALLLRLIPAHSFVLLPGEVNFQEGDAWFHMRTIHNILNHFPYRSGFDPFALYPGGSRIPTGPFWDWAVAIVAWIAGLGKPSALLVDCIGAVLPAVFGALVSVGVYLLASRLFGTLAGWMAALWIAAMPGLFLWITRLGLADHHAAESLFSLLMIVAFAAALEKDGRARQLLALAGGLAAGALLATRPAAAFALLPVTFAAALAPELADVLLIAMPAAALVFAPATGSIGAASAWLAIAGCLAAALLIALLARLWRNRGWSYLPVALIASGAALVVLLSMFGPAAWTGPLREAHRVLFTKAGHAETVYELAPLIYTGLNFWNTLFSQLGGSWIFLIPGLLIAIFVAIRTRRPALILFAVWALTTTFLGFAQVRNLAYFSPVAAILAGVATAKLVRGGVPQRAVTIALLIAIIVGTGVPFAIGQVSQDTGPSADWRQALRWLRSNSPEPLPPGTYDALLHSPPTPAATAYGVLSWWDYGYWIEFLAQRIPVANGTQNGAGETADFWTETDATHAASVARGLGARYLVVGPSMAFYERSPESKWPAMLEWTGRQDSQYWRMVYQKTDDGMRALIIYLPDYYRSMASRLYFHGGAADTDRGAWVIELHREADARGQRIDVVDSAQKFDSAEAAHAEIARRPGAYLIFGGLDPTISCVPLDPVPWARPVYTTNADSLRTSQMVRTVRIFEVAAQ